MDVASLAEKLKQQHSPSQNFQILKMLQPEQPFTKFSHIHCGKISTHIVHLKSQNKQNCGKNKLHLKEAQRKEKLANAVK
jgi:hypothetical protein